MTGFMVQPRLDRIVINIMPDASARLLALEAGEVDYIDQYDIPLSAYGLLAKALESVGLRPGVVSRASSQRAIWGQRQRLTITRARPRQPPLIVAVSVLRC
jgi:ABC-type transport system substrate-binding protein